MKTITIKNQNSVTDAAKKLAENMLKKQGIDNDILNKASVSVSGYVSKADGRDRAVIDVSLDGQAMRIYTNTDKSADKGQSLTDNSLYMSQIIFKEYSKQEAKYVEVNASALKQALKSLYQSIKQDVRVYVPQVVFDRYMELKDLVFKGYSEKVQNKQGREVMDIYVSDPERSDYINKDGVKVERFTIDIHNHSDEILSLNMVNGGPEMLVYKDFTIKDGDNYRNVYLKDSGSLKFIRTPNLVSLAKEVDTYLAKDEPER